MEGNYSVVFSPEANDESIKARLWYEEIQQGLGDAFRESLEIKIKLIRQSPNYASFIYKNVRSLRLKRFPFNIIYRVSNLQIQIIAVFHHSRNPREWKRRI
jgi:plasmid stabilization system protein ParE